MGKLWGRIEGRNPHATEVALYVALFKAHACNYEQLVDPSIGPSFAINPSHQLVTALANSHVIKCFSFLVELVYQ